MFDDTLIQDVFEVCCEAKSDYYVEVIIEMQGELGRADMENSFLKSLLGQS